MALGDRHSPTPQKAGLFAVAGYLQTHKIPCFKADLYRPFGIGERRGVQILHDGDEHVRQHPEVETRGRTPLLTLANLLAMESILWEYMYGFQARALS